MGASVGERRMRRAVDRGGRVCVFSWAGGGGVVGREGFPLSHKADGSDLSGCSQSQQGQVYPAAVWKSRDSATSLSPLRISLLSSSLPAPKPNCEHLYARSTNGTEPGHIVWQSLDW